MVTTTEQTPFSRKTYGINCLTLLVQALIDFQSHQRRDGATPATGSCMAEELRSIAWDSFARGAKKRSDLNPQTTFSISLGYNEQPVSP